MKRALVTGGSGFIGSELIRELGRQGIAVRALLRKTSPLANLQGAQYEAAFGELNDVDSLKKAVAGVDYVFHLAGVVAARSKDEFFRHNTEGTSNLARACAEVNPGVKRFVYVSSLAASGPAGSLTPRTENDTAAPISAYGESKLAGEKELERWAKQAGFSFTVVRPPAVYGPRDRGIFELIKMVNNGILPVFPANNQTGEKYYSVVHVDDLVRGIALAGLAAGQGAAETFFLTGDGVHSWSQLMGAMAERLGKKPVRIALPAFAWAGFAAIYTAAGWLFGKQFPLTLDKLNEFKPDFWICSNERAKQILKFSPQWDLKRGMDHTIGWYKENGWM